MDSITISGRTLRVSHGQIHEPVEPGEVLLSQAPFCDNLNTGCIIAGQLRTHEGTFSQIHQYRDGRYFVYGPIATPHEAHPSQRDRYTTPEEAVRATLISHYDQTSN